jgi:hypothetical protein
VDTGADLSLYKKVLRKLNHGQHVDVHYMNVLVMPLFLLCVVLFRGLVGV